MTDAPLIVGLTGGIGSGKSTVAAAFRQLGITCVDADQIAREVVKPGTPALQQITAHFGGTILHSDNSLNRAALRKIVFGNPAEKNWLESLLHPLIRKTILDRLKSADSPYVILESPLLLETDQHQLCAKIIVVDVPQTVQIERASARDENSSAQIQQIIDAQMPRSERLQRADFVFDNTQALDSIALRVEELHGTLLKLTKEPQ